MNWTPAQKEFIESTAHRAVMIGDNRVGKTEALKEIAERHLQHGRHVVVLGQNLNCIRAEGYPDGVFLVSLQQGQDVLRGHVAETILLDEVSLWAVPPILASDVLRFDIIRSAFTPLDAHVVYAPVDQCPHVPDEVKERVKEMRRRA